MKRRGFTLIELLVVIAVIGLLSSIILAAVTSARKKADEASVLEAMHQLQSAIEMYQLNTGHYPCDTGPTCGTSGQFSSAGPGFIVYTDLADRQFSGVCSSIDDFHCVLNNFLVNGTTKFIPSIFSLPASFDTSSVNNDAMTYEIPNNVTTTVYCNGSVAKNYVITINAPDHQIMISTMKEKRNNTTFNNVGCIGG